MEDKPLRELHTLFTKIKNVSVNSTKRFRQQFTIKSGTNAIGKI